MFKLGTLVFVFSVSIPGFGSDWVMQQSTEPSPDQAQRTLLFVQPQYAISNGKDLNAGPFKGEKGIFNLNAPEFRDVASFQIVRAFAMVRGNIPETEGKLNYLGLLDFGENLLTGSERTTKNPTNLQLADLSMTASYIPGVRLRLGQFMTPSSNEMMRSIQTYDFANFTNFTIFTMLDWNMPTNGDGSSANLPQYPNAGFRDIGIMAFDAFKSETMTHTYALMIGNGNGISRWEHDGNNDLHWRYRFEWNKDTEQNLEFVLWGTQGKRDLINNGVPGTFKRQRTGIDLAMKFSQWRIDLGYGSADGIIFHGTLGAGQPGVVNGTAQVASFLTLPSETALGQQIAVNYDYSVQTTFNVRYDEINYGLRESINERKFSTLTLGTHYKIDPKLPTKILFNYELKDAIAPNLSSSSAVNQFLSGVGDRATVTLFWFL